MDSLGFDNFFSDHVRISAAAGLLGDFHQGLHDGPPEVTLLLQETPLHHAFDCKAKGLMSCEQGPHRK